MFYLRCGDLGIKADIPLSIVASSAKVRFGLGWVSQPSNPVVLASIRPHGATLLLGRSPSNGAGREWQDTGGRRGKSLMS